MGLQDGIGWEDVTAFSAGALTVLTLLTVIFRKPIARFATFLEWVEKFQADWDGEPAREGRDHTPGVMERLNAIDGEFKHNGGSTLKDAMYRTERKVDEVSTRLQVVEKAQRDNDRRATEQRDSMTTTLDTVDGNTKGKEGT